MKVLKIIALFIFLAGLVFLFSDWAGAHTFLLLSFFVLACTFFIELLLAVFNKRVGNKLLLICWKLTALLWVTAFIFKFMYWQPWVLLQILAFIFTILSIGLAVPAVKKQEQLQLLLAPDKFIIPLIILCIAASLIPHSSLIFATEIYFEGRMTDQTRYLESRCEAYRRYTFQLRREGRWQRLKVAENEEFRYCNQESSGIEVIKVTKAQLEKIAAASDTSYPDTTGFAASGTQLAYFLNRKTGDTAEILRDRQNRVLFVGQRRNGNCLFSAEYYLNGQIKCRTIKDQKLANSNFCFANGVRKCYYEDGRISAEGEYRNGKKVGVWKAYDQSGKPTLIEHFNKNGEVIRRQSVKGNG